MSDTDPLREYTRELFDRALEDDEQPHQTTDPLPQTEPGIPADQWRGYINRLFDRA